MNIQTVAENLRNTITGKEMLLAEYNNPSFSATHRLVKEAMVQYLELNIGELKRILADVEVCCTQANEASWALNPDRSGGAFTAEESTNAHI
jgi:hypothetical protein